MHIPVLLQEVIKYLEPKSGKRFIDATVGGGGHSRALLERGGKVLAIDQDPSVIPHLMRDPELDFRFPPALTSSKRSRAGRGNDIAIVAGNFSDLRSIAENRGFTEVDGILFDLGMGSHQLDDPKRGFSFQKEGPLDMRYDPSGKSQNPNPKSQTAAEIINYYSEKELTGIFYKFGEEKRFGKNVARAIVKSRKIKPIETTTELFDLIKQALPGSHRHKAGDTARRIFQSLRIKVNQELGNLEKALPQAVDLLKTGGRLVTVSFHSLEDRIVKQFFVSSAKICVCPPDFPICRCEAKARLRILTKKPVTASPEEIKTNPRAGSAKLRAAEKL